MSALVVNTKKKCSIYEDKKKRNEMKKKYYLYGHIRHSLDWL